MRANNYDGPNFSTNIGIPQSDGSSPVLFTLYLETVLKEVRNKIRAQDISYADDVDFSSKEGINFTKVKKIFKKRFFHTNNDKTEVLTIERNSGE